MRTSLNEVKLIDDHLFNRSSPENSLLFDARLILNPALTDKVMWQRNAHTLINQYSRKKLEAEIDAVYIKLFNETRHKTFREKILSFFS